MKAFGDYWSETTLCSLSTAAVMNSSPCLLTTKSCLYFHNKLYGLLLLKGLTELRPLTFMSVGLVIHQTTAHLMCCLLRYNFFL